MTAAATRRLAFYGESDAVAWPTGPLQPAPGFLSPGPGPLRTEAPSHDSEPESGPPPGLVRRADQ